MVAVDAQQRNWQFGKVFFAQDIKSASMEVNAGIPKYNLNIVTAGLHLIAKDTDALKAPVCIASQVYHFFLRSSPRTFRDTANPATASSS